MFSSNSTIAVKVTSALLIMILTWLLIEPCKTISQESAILHNWLIDHPFLDFSSLMAWYLESLFHLHDCVFLLIFLRMQSPSLAFLF